MKLIDDEYMKRPESGSRTMRDFLERQGRIVNRKRIRRLMRLMGFEAIYPRPKTRTPHPEHRIYPCLLRGLDINRPDMAWNCIEGCYEPSRMLHPNFSFYKIAGFRYSYTR